MYKRVNGEWTNDDYSMLEEIEIAQKCGMVELEQSKAGLIEVYNGGQQS